jgi:hypothetical protein
MRTAFDCLARSARPDREAKMQADVSSAIRPPPPFSPRATKISRGMRTRFDCLARSARSDREAKMQADATSAMLPSVRD